MRSFVIPESLQLLEEDPEQSDVLGVQDVLDVSDGAEAAAVVKGELVSPLDSPAVDPFSSISLLSKTCSSSLQHSAIPLSSGGDPLLSPHSGGSALADVTLALGNKDVLCIQQQDLFDKVYALTKWVQHRACLPACFSLATAPAPQCLSSFILTSETHA